MIIQILTDDRYRRLVWLLVALGTALLAGCQNTDGGGGAY
jgi:predicted small secreted protein